MSIPNGVLEIISETWKNANSYLLHIGEGWVIDPGAMRPEDCAAKTKHLLATHAHYDHIAGLESWGGEDFSFYLHKGDIPMLEDEEANASKLFAHKREFPQPQRILEDGDKLEMGDGWIATVWHTPGHTQGSACFLLAQDGKNIMLFSGDTIFADNIGRSDLIGGDPKQMRDSVEKLLLRLQKLDKDLVILPGHGAATTVDYVLQRNPFFRKGGFFSI